MCLSCAFKNYSLANLETLELRDNLLKFLPQSLANLSKLRVLDLGSNLLDDLVSLLLLFKISQFSVLFSYIFSSVLTRKAC